MSDTTQEEVHESLAGHFLIAMPSLESDDFARTVIFLCDHNAHGAMGLVINKTSDQALAQLFKKIDLPLRRNDLLSQPVYQGGPVQTERGFVLHERVAAPQEVHTPNEIKQSLADAEVSQASEPALPKSDEAALEIGVDTSDEEDNNEDDTSELQAAVLSSIKTQLALVASQQTAYDLSLRIPGELEMTSSRDILEALSNGLGPQKVFMSLGYAAWAGGQLESEIARNDWLSVPARKDLIFDEPVHTRYDKALALLGLKSWMISAQSGRA
jgi:putative transcriptional regulator